MKLEYKKDLFPLKKEFEVWVDNQKYGIIQSGQKIELDLKDNSKRIKIISDGFEYASKDISEAKNMTIKSFQKSPMTWVIFALMIAVIYLKNFKGFEQGSWLILLLLLYPVYFNTIGKKYYYTLK